MYQLITTKGRKSDDEPENDLRWALRLEEARALGLTVRDGGIYFTPRSDVHSVYLRKDAAHATLVDNRAMVSCELRDFESLAEVAAAVEREGRE